MLPSKDENSKKFNFLDWAGCLSESDVLKEYEKVDTFVYLGSTIEARAGFSERICAGTWKISNNWTMECHM